MKTKPFCVYHIYPLGFCGAPRTNDFVSPPENRLERVLPWLPHITEAGADTLYLGPVFESTAHGYDTADYRTVDRRLGDNAALRGLVEEARNRGIAVVLDAVLNHTGRDFPPFKDLLEKGEASPYRGWFKGVDFSRRSSYGDSFAYEGWNGHYNLVRLEVDNPAVREYLFSAVRFWMEEFGIKGLRLDACDCLSADFVRALAGMCREKDPDFWLMGEIIHGDYSSWAGPGMLDSVTNYECYKGLWSSFNDGNLFEIAYSLNRQFGPQGLYRDLLLYSFADNHDVDRVADTVRNPAHLYPLYGLLFTMPGVPSLYYGSEWGVRGKKSKGDDGPVRPVLDLSGLMKNPPAPDLFSCIRRFCRLRRESAALSRGGYRQIFVGSRQFVFERYIDGERILVAVNGDDKQAGLTVPVPSFPGEARDILNDEIIPRGDGRLTLSLYPNWLRVIRY